MDRNTAAGLVTIILGAKKLWPEVVEALPPGAAMGEAENAAAQALSLATNAHSASASRTTASVIALLQRTAEGLDASEHSIVEPGDLVDESPQRRYTTKPFDFIALVGKIGESAEDRRTVRLIAAGSLCFSLWRRVASIAVGTCKMKDCSSTVVRKALRERFPSFEEATLAERLDLANDLFVRVASMFEDKEEMTSESCFDLALAIRIITEVRDQERSKLGSVGQHKVASLVTRNCEKTERAVKDKLGRCRVLFFQVQTLLALVREAAE